MWLSCVCYIQNGPDRILKLPVQVGGVGIQVVSLFWFYKIVQVCVLDRNACYQPFCGDSAKRDGLFMQIAVWRATQSGKTKVHAQ